MRTLPPMRVREKKNEKPRVWNETLVLVFKKPPLELQPEKDVEEEKWKRKETLKQIGRFFFA